MQLAVSSLFVSYGSVWIFEGGCGCSVACPAFKHSIPAWAPKE